MKELKSLNILYTKDSIDETFKNFLKDYIKNIEEIENIHNIHSYNFDILITNYDSDFIELKKNLKNKKNNFLVFLSTPKQFSIEECEDCKFITKTTPLIEILSFLKKSIKNFDSNQSNIINLKNELWFDSYNLFLFKKKKNIACSKKELAFLDFILQNQNRVVTYEEINESIWEGGMTNDALRSIVKELRKKTYRELIKNISGMGYRINIQ